MIAGESYKATAKILHWTIAFGLTLMLASGFYMEGLPIGELKLKLYGLHKSFGVLVLLLVFVRLAHRLYNKAPEFPQNVKYIVHFVHFALYGFMLAMPISGLLLSDAAGFPASFFGLFTIPNVIGYNAGYMKVFFSAHQTLAILGMIAIIGHIFAALFHHFILKDNILKRML